jgi:transcriptional regulator with XRE-family HTH domain
VQTARDVVLLMRDTRLRRRMTQGGLAAVMGVTRQAVANMEAGRTTPSIAVVLAALHALDLSMDVRSTEGHAARADDPVGTAHAAPAHASSAPIDLDAVLAAVRDGGEH